MGESLQADESLQAAIEDNEGNDAQLQAAIARSYETARDEQATRGATGTGQPPFRAETGHETGHDTADNVHLYQSITMMAAYQVWAERTSLFTPSPSATHSVNPRDRTRHRTKHRARAHSLTPAP